MILIVFESAGYSVNAHIIIIIFFKAYCHEVLHDSYPIFLLIINLCFLLPLLENVHAVHFGYMGRTGFFRDIFNVRSVFDGLYEEVFATGNIMIAVLLNELGIIIIRISEHIGTILFQFLFDMIIYILVILI